VANAADLLLALAGHCQVVVAEHGSLLASMFLTGLVGSFTHCTGMCGPLVAAQSVENLGRQLPGPGAAWRRLAGAALIPYQLGRMTTYAALAAVLSLPVGLARFWQPLWWLPPVLLAFAAGLFVLQALHGFGVAWPNRDRVTVLPGKPDPGSAAGKAGAGYLYRGTSGIIALARPLFRHPTGWRGYGLGLLLGFLPCGLLYAALAAAASSADILAAALSMIVFTLGTFPISWAIGFGSVIAATRWRRTFRAALPYLAVLNALLLIALAYRTVLAA
jgi:hypothetical protein